LIMSLSSALIIAAIVIGICLPSILGQSNCAASTPRVVLVGSSNPPYPPSTCNNRTDTFPAGVYWCAPLSITLGWGGGEGIIFIQTNYFCNTGTDQYITFVGSHWGGGGAGNSATFYPNVNSDYISMVNATNDASGPGGQIGTLQFFQSQNGASPNYGSASVGDQNPISPPPSFAALQSITVCVGGDGGSVVSISYNWMNCYPKILAV